MKCNSCNAEFDIREYSPGHVGFDIFRCDSCACSIAKHKASIPPNFSGNRLVEEYFQSCECGGQFRKNALQRCPECRSVIPVASFSFKPDSEVTKRDSGHYYVMGFERDLVWK